MKSRRLCISHNVQLPIMNGDAGSKVIKCSTSVQLCFVQLIFHLKTFPPEIIHQILIMLYQPDLTSVALVNHTFQAEADRLLYKSIDGRSFSMERLLQCFDTVIGARSKAILVKSLFVDMSNPGSLLIECLCECLLALPSLTLLYLCFPPHIAEQVVSPLSLTLRCVTR